MPGQIEESFGIAEIGSDHTTDRGDARIGVAFEQGARGGHEIADAGLDFLFETAKSGNRLLGAAYLGIRDSLDPKLAPTVLRLVTGVGRGARSAGATAATPAASAQGQPGAA